MLFGYTHEEIYELFRKYANEIKYLDVKNILKGIGGLVFKRKIIINGLNSGESLERIINNACGEKGIDNIEQIKMPLLVPAVNLHTGGVYCFSSKKVRTHITDKVVYINNADIGKAVRASCSYPVIFSPCIYKNLELVDGGLRENVPWKQVRDMGADKVISVVFDQELTDKKHDTMLDVISSSIDILKHELLDCETEGADFLLEIHTKKIALLDTKRIEELYNLGYAVAKKKTKEIKEMTEKI